MSADDDALPVELDQAADPDRVTVAVGGKQLTAYLFGGDPRVLQKPALYPLRGPTGIDVTRGYPLDPRLGERTDHPHHIGSWLAYGAHPGINGVNFWNVSDEIRPPEATEKGRIVHQEIEHMTGGEERGELVVSATWERGDGEVLLDERTQFQFAGTPDRRIIDRETTLSPTSEPVTFPDDKEGMFAVRVARELELPGAERTRPPPEVVGPSGQPSDPTPELHVNPTGEYLSATGETGTDVWGTRAPWMRLSGEREGTELSLTIMDHPSNPGHPTHWHARGYGLLAANPLGQSIFSDGETELNFRLEPGESATFRFRVAIDAGVPAADALDRRHAAFADTS